MTYSDIQQQPMGVLAHTPLEPARPRRVGRVARYEIDGEVVLFDPKRNRVHNLNLTASVIWELCDGTRTVEELAEDMACLFEVEVAVVHSDVKRTVTDFSRSHLLRHGLQPGD